MLVAAVTLTGLTLATAYAALRWPAWAARRRHTAGLDATVRRLTGDLTGARESEHRAHADRLRIHARLHAMEDQAARHRREAAGLERLLQAAAGTAKCPRCGHLRPAAATPMPTTTRVWVAA